MITILKNFFLACTFLITMACESDGECGVQPEADSLTGTWNLVDISCECDPVVLNKGDHQWTFKPSASEITIKHNMDSTSTLLLKEGTYEAIFSAETIMINGITYKYYFQNSKLFLDFMSETDGPLMTFVK